MAGENAPAGGDRRGAAGEGNVAPGPANAKEAPHPAFTGPSVVTLIRACDGRRLAKVITPSGVETADLPLFVACAPRRVGSLAEMTLLVRELQGQPAAAIIRAAPLATANLARMRRLLDDCHERDGSTTPRTLAEVPRAWCALDLDSVPAHRPDWSADLFDAGQHIARLLPPGLRGAGFVIQASASAGIKPGLRAKLFLLLDRPATGAELRRAFAASPFDPVTFTANQLIYTARPIFRGVVDPVPARTAVLPGPRGRLWVPPEPPPRPVAPRRAPVTVAGRYARAALDGEARAVVEAPAGGNGQRGRHWRLSTAGLKLGRYVAAGDLTEGEAITALAGAAAKAGLDDNQRELARIVRRALRQGAPP